MIPGMILWRVWKARNVAKFENMKMLTSDSIITNVREAIQHVYRAFNLKLKQGKTSLKATKFYDFASVPYEEIVTLVHWLPPSRNCFKLNSDGACKNNPGLSGAGGIIRDTKENFVKEHSFFLHICTSLFAETKVLPKDLKIAVGSGISKLWIEVDSKVHVDMHKESCSVPWFISYLFKRHLLLFQNITISHIYREGNTCVDSFANYATEMQENIVFNHIGKVPRHIHGEIWLNKT